MIKFLRKVSHFLERGGVRGFANAGWILQKWVSAKWLGNVYYWRPVVAQL